MPLHPAESTAGLRVEAKEEREEEGKKNSSTTATVALASVPSPVVRSQRINKGKGGSLSKEEPAARAKRGRDEVEGDDGDEGSVASGTGLAGGRAGKRGRGAAGEGERKTQGAEETMEKEGGEGGKPGKRGRASTVNAPPILVPKLAALSQSLGASPDPATLLALAPSVCTHRMAANWVRWGIARGAINSYRSLQRVPEEHFALSVSALNAPFRSGGNKS